MRRSIDIAMLLWFPPAIISSLSHTSPQRPYTLASGPLSSHPSFLFHPLFRDFLAHIRPSRQCCILRSPQRLLITPGSVPCFPSLQCTRCVRLRARLRSIVAVLTFSFGISYVTNGHTSWVIPTLNPTVQDVHLCPVAPLPHPLLPCTTALQLYCCSDGCSVEPPPLIPFF